MVTWKLTQGAHTSSVSVYLCCCVLLFLWLGMANLSDLVGFALTVAIRYKKETRVESSFFTGLARRRFSPRN